MKNSGRLGGRVAWITGGGRGIGRAIALAMASEGAAISVSARTKTEIGSAIKEVESLGCKGLAVQADHMKLEDIRKAAHIILNKFGQIDILVNNAGGVVWSEDMNDLVPWTHDDQLFLDNLNLNLVSAWRATREVLPHMVNRKYGRIIFIGSGYSLHAGGLLVYTVSKHGMVGMTRALAAYTGELGITVNTLCPGWVRTALVEWDKVAVLGGLENAEAAKKQAEADSLQKRIMEAEEMGPMSVLLASEESAGITGQVICVDAGFKV